jgi:hypothetical protein
MSQHFLILLKHRSNFFSDEVILPETLLEQIFYTNVASEQKQNAKKDYAKVAKNQLHRIYRRRLSPERNHGITVVANKLCKSSKTKKEYLAKTIC